MLSFLRQMIALALAFCVGVGLFLVMASMISRGDALGNRGDDISGVEFVRLKREPELKVKEREVPKKPPPPDKPPPPPKLQVESPDQPQQDLPALQIPSLDLPSVGGSGPNLAGYAIGADAKGNRGLIPKIQIPPMYPRKAQLEGLEGSVTFDLLVGTDGSVLEASVVDFTDRVFVRPAQRAIYRWKFEPRLVEGEPVEQRDKWTLEFQMAE